MTSDESAGAAADQVAREAGRLDVLVNNAGIVGGPADPLDTVPGDFLAVYGVNLLGPVRVTHPRPRRPHRGLLRRRRPGPLVSAR